MIQLKKIAEPLSKLVLKLKAYFVLGVVLALSGFLVWQIQKILQPPVNKERLEQRELELEINRIKLDEATLDEVLQRSQTGQNTEPNATGDPNPFD